MARHNDLGKEGERRAADYLRQAGYTILETNWCFAKAEIDILARYGDLLVVIEVKTRSDIGFGLPQDFVNPRKIKLLLTAVNHYAEQINFDGQIRFDIIALVPQGNQWQLEHLEDAFYYFPS